MQVEQIEKNNADEADTAKNEGDTSGRSVNKSLGVSHKALFKHSEAEGHLVISSSLTPGRRALGCLLSGNEHPPD